MRGGALKGLITILISVISVTGLQFANVSPASADAEISGPILAKYQSVGGEAVLGEAEYEALPYSPRTGLVGEWQEFTNGNIYWSEETGARVVFNSQII